MRGALKRYETPAPANRPPPVDNRLGFVDAVRYGTDHPALAAIAKPDDLDKLRVGEMDNRGRIYLGRGAYMHHNFTPR